MSGWMTQRAAPRAFEQFNRLVNEVLPHMNEGQPTSSVDALG